MQNLGVTIFRVDQEGKISYLKKKNHKSNNIFFLLFVKMIISN